MLKQRKVDAAEHASHWHKYNAQGQLTSSGYDPVALEQPVFFEFIETFGGPRVYKPCTHIKYHSVVLKRDIRFDYYTGAYQTWSDSPFPYMLGVNTYPIAQQPTLGLVQFMRRGFQATRPKFKGKVSVPNFLFELKDIKRSVRNIIKNANLLVSKRIPHQNPFTRKMKLWIRREGKSGGPVKQVAEDYLDFMFGYLPLMRDIFDLQTVVEDYNKDLAKLRKYEHHTEHSHFREIVGRMSLEPVSIGSNFYSEIFYIDEIGDVSWVFNWSYNYFIDWYKIYVPALFLRYIGFRENPRIIWDAIPFSFVIDWVLKVGKSLEALDDGALPVRLNVLDAMVSFSYGCLRKFYIRDISNSIGTANFGNGTLFAQEGWTVYDRRRLTQEELSTIGVPPLPVTDELSVKEISLAAALGIVLLL